MVAADPAAWWSALVQLAKSEPLDSSALDRLGNYPLVALLRSESSTYERIVVETAHDEPAIAALAFVAFESIHQARGNLYAGEAAAVSLLGLDTTVAAWIRIAERCDAIGWNAEGFNTVDFWAFHLGGHLARANPELGWDYVRHLVAAVPERFLLHVGSGDLEDFCWAAATTYIDQIELEARRDPRFRIALGAVWPGGESMPPEVYDRIRRAAAAT